MQCPHPGRSETSAREDSGRHHLALSGRRSTRCYGGTSHDSHRGAGFAVCPRSVAGHPRRGLMGRVGRFRSGHVVVQPTLPGWRRRTIIGNLRVVLACRRSPPRSERPHGGCFPRTRCRGWPGCWKAGCPMSRSRGQGATRPVDATVVDSHGGDPLPPPRVRRTKPRRPYCERAPARSALAHESRLLARAYPPDSAESWRSPIVTVR